MKRYILILLFLLVGLLVSGQDIVYDSIMGNKSNWFRMKGGPSETYIKISYENQAILTQSKILSAAGLLAALEKGIDYVDYHLDYDTMTYEFKTDVPINVIIYKYFTNDTTSNFYVGLRKASLGSTMFEGQYLFISPLVVLESEVKIYDGIGINRNLFLSLKPSELTDNSIQDYELSNQVTVQGIKVSRTIRSSKTRGVLTNIDDELIPTITCWPNPVSDNLHIEILNNKGVMIRIFDNLPILRYQKRTDMEEIIINLSPYSSGVYILVITDEKMENIISVIKIIKK